MISIGQLVRGGSTASWPLRVIVELPRLAFPRRVPEAGADQSPLRNGPPSSCMLSDATDVDAASAERFLSGASRA